MPLYLPLELGLNKLFQTHLKNMTQELIGIMETNEIMNSQLGEILAIVKVVSFDLEWEYYIIWDVSYYSIKLLNDKTRKIQIKIDYNLPYYYYNLITSSI